VANNSVLLCLLARTAAALRWPADCACACGLSLQDGAGGGGALLDGRTAPVFGGLCDINVELVRAAAALRGRCDRLAAACLARYPYMPIPATTYLPAFLLPTAPPSTGARRFTLYLRGARRHRRQKERSTDATMTWFWCVAHAFLEDVPLTERSAHDSGPLFLSDGSRQHLPVSAPSAATSRLLPNYSAGKDYRGSGGRTWKAVSGAGRGRTSWASSLWRRAALCSYLFAAAAPAAGSWLRGGRAAFCGGMRRGRRRFVQNGGRHGFGMRGAAATKWRVLPLWRLPPHSLRAVWFACIVDVRRGMLYRQLLACNTSAVRKIFYRHYGVRAGRRRVNRRRDGRRRLQPRLMPYLPSAYRPYVPRCARAKLPRFHAAFTLPPAAARTTLTPPGGGRPAAARAANYQLPRANGAGAATTPHTCALRALCAAAPLRRCSMPAARPLA